MTVLVTSDPTVVITGDAPQVEATVAVTNQPIYSYNNLMDLPTLGTAAALDVGTGALNIVELDGSAKLPVVDGSQLTMLPARNLNCGRLIWVSTTQIKFIPFRGALAQINGVLYVIPAAGITISNAGLAASTTYYAYISISAGSMILTLATTSHAISSTTNNFGVEIKSGDDNYSLVGIIRTTSGILFADSATQRFVASWFNQRPRPMNNVITAHSTATGTWVEVGTASERVEFVSWASTATTVQFNLGVDLPDNGVSATTGYAQVAMDSVRVGGGSLGYTGVVGNNYMTLSASWTDEFAEGYHHAEVYWNSGASGYTLATVGSYSVITGTAFI